MQGFDMILGAHAFIDSDREDPATALASLGGAAAIIAISGLRKSKSGDARFRMVLTMRKH